MKVTFAYPRTVGERQYAPDETAEIDDALAKRLIHDGLARAADTTTRTSKPTGRAAAGPDTPEAGT